MNTQILKAKNKVNALSVALQEAKARLLTLEAKAKSARKVEAKNKQLKLEKNRVAIGLYALKSGSKNMAAQKFGVSVTVVSHCLVRALNSMPGFSQDDYLSEIMKPGIGQWKSAKIIYGRLSSNAK